VNVNLKTLGPGVKLRSHTTDIFVLKEILADDILHALPADPSVQTVVDLGANTGLSYRWLHQRYPQAKFVCVEPDAGNAAVLRENVAASNGHCRIVPACIGAYERTVGLHSESGEWGFEMVEGGGEIAVMTMDQVLADSGIDRIDILKCDVEGAEDELFADCRSWIHRVRKMVVECHGRPMTADSLLAAIAANGCQFRLTHVESNGPFEMATLEAV
jgi:FkbM family methyltransferase